MLADTARWRKAQPRKWHESHRVSRQCGVSHKRTQVHTHTNDYTITRSHDSTEAHARYPLSGPLPSAPSFTYVLYLSQALDVGPENVKPMRQPTSRCRTAFLHRAHVDARPQCNCTLRADGCPEPVLMLLTLETTYGGPRRPGRASYEYHSDIPNGWRAGETTSGGTSFSADDEKPRRMHGSVSNGLVDVWGWRSLRWRLTPR